MVRNSGSFAPMRCGRTNAIDRYGFEPILNVGGLFRAGERRL